MAHKLLKTLLQSPSLPSNDLIGNWSETSLLIVQFNASCKEPVSSRFLTEGFLWDSLWDITVKHGTLSLIFDLPHACCRSNAPDCFDTFTMLDEIVARLWRNPHKVSKESLQHWQEFRYKVLGKREIRKGTWLGYNYFNNRHPSPAFDSLEALDPVSANILRTNGDRLTAWDSARSLWVEQILDDTGNWVPFSTSA